MKDTKVEIKTSVSRTKSL